MGYTIGNDSVAQTSVILKKQSYLENNDLYAEKYRSTYQWKDLFGIYKLLTI